jgi:hypothetical protein
VGSATVEIVDRTGAVAPLRIYGASLQLLSLIHI